MLKVIVTANTSSVSFADTFPSKGKAKNERRQHVTGTAARYLALPSGEGGPAKPVGEVLATLPLC